MDDLGAKLAEFVNKVSHPRGRALVFMTEANVTVAQVILMNSVATGAAATPSEISHLMGLSISSASQMIERLVKLSFLDRYEDADDRRKKTIVATDKAKEFLDQLRVIRANEFEHGVAPLSQATRDLLAEAVNRALAEIAEKAGGQARKGRAGQNPNA
jgi:DNA-binding MarR family transcriptional regulator